MYNLKLFMHNRLVIIKLVMLEAITPICATEEPNRFYCQNVLNTQHVGIHFFKCVPGV